MDDYIMRSDVLKFNLRIDVLPPLRANENRIAETRRIAENVASELFVYIQSFPAADVAPVVHGHWIPINNPCYSPFDGSDPYIYVCSACIAQSRTRSEFCPHCGAKLDDRAGWKTAEEKAVPVPPHGRLIDADELAEKHRELAYERSGANYDFHMTAKAWVDNAPTIIPAGREGE